MKTAKLLLGFCLILVSVASFAEDDRCIRLETAHVRISACHQTLTFRDKETGQLLNTVYSPVEFTSNIIELPSGRILVGTAGHGNSSSLGCPQDSCAFLIETDWNGSGERVIPKRAPGHVGGPHEEYFFMNLRLQENGDVIALMRQLLFLECRELEYIAPDWETRIGRKVRCPESRR